MIWYPAGAEIPGWRTLLHDSGVRHMAMSYVGLARRIKNTASWSAAKKFPEDTHVFLESGAHTVNKQPDLLAGEELTSLIAAYLDFAEANNDRIAIATEFDAIRLEPHTRLEQRTRLHELLQDRFLPIWHENTGLDELRRLAEKFGRVGVLQAGLGGRDITSVLLGLARSGIRLHGAAMTKIDAMRHIPWDSVSSTSWLSPAQYSDTIVWTGHTLKRYPKRYATQARKRHRTLFTQNGFDAQAIEAGNPTELLRLSIWSWTKYVDHLNTHAGPVNEPAKTDTTTKAESAPERVDEPPTRPRNSTRPKDNRPGNRRTTRSTLPGITVVDKTVRERDENGVRQERRIGLLATVGESSRVCDGCFLREKCPAYEPESDCAYDLPVEARTRDQLARLQEVLIEIQTQRVMFARFAEELEGGYPDPNLGQELDRLQKMLKTKSDMDSEGFSLTVKAQSRSSAETGLIGRLFGADAGTAARAIEPTRAEDVAHELGIVDAELV